MRALQGGNITLSFSQLGEDSVILWMFAGKRRGFYVDVGCHHPFRYSNTAALHLMFDWRGVNIDVEERAIDLFRTERPNDINICVGVGDRTGSFELNSFSDWALTTLDPVSAANPYFANVARETRTVPVRRLDDILGEVVPHGQSVDFLNVDCEGLDLEVLVSNDWTRFRPELVAVETHGMTLRTFEENPVSRFLMGKDYELASHVGVTSIFKSRAI